MSETSRHLLAEEIERVAFSGAGSPHLSSCARCASEVAHAKARKDLLRAIPASELTEMESRRIEARVFAALDEAQAKPSWFAIPRLVPVAGFALAAALAAGLFALRAPTITGGESRPALVASAERPLVQGHATIVQGVVSMRADAQAEWQPLEAGAALTEGAQLRTTEGQASIALGPGTGILLEANSTLAFASLRDGKTHLALSSGRVACEVRPLTGDASFTVSAGSREVYVVGTAFAVAYSPERMLVEVQHGVVALGDAADPAQRAEVRGPGRREVIAGETIASTPATELTPEETLVLARSTEWQLATPSQKPLARFTFADLPAGARINIDDLGFGPAPWTGMLAIGKHHIETQIAGEPARSGFVDVNPGGSIARLGQFSLSMPTPAPVPQRVHVEVAAPPVDPRELTAAIKSQLGEVRGCYERWLKRDLRAAGTIVLVLEIRADGGVQRVGAKGLILPDETEDCFASAATRLHLPSIGDALTVEVPLRLSAQQ